MPAVPERENVASSTAGPARRADEAPFVRRHGGQTRRAAMEVARVRTLPVTQEHRVRLSVCARPPHTSQASSTSSSSSPPPSCRTAASMVRTSRSAASNSARPASAARAQRARGGGATRRARSARDEAITASSARLSRSRRILRGEVLRARPPKARRAAPTPGERCAVGRRKHDAARLAFLDDGIPLEAQPPRRRLPWRAAPRHAASNALKARAARRARLRPRLRRARALRCRTRAPRVRAPLRAARRWRRSLLSASRRSAARRAHRLGLALCRPVFVAVAAARATKWPSAWPMRRATRRRVTWASL